MGRNTRMDGPERRSRTRRAMRMIARRCGRRSASWALRSIRWKTCWHTVSGSSLNFNDVHIMTCLALGNWCEIALRKLGCTDVFCHVGDEGLHVFHRYSSLVFDR